MKKLKKKVMKKNKKNILIQTLIPTRRIFMCQMGIKEMGMEMGIKEMEMEMGIKNKLILI